MQDLPARFDAATPAARSGSGPRGVQVPVAPHSRATLQASVSVAIDPWRPAKPRRWPLAPRGTAGVVATTGSFSRRCEPIPPRYVLSCTGTIPRPHGVTPGFEGLAAVSEDTASHSDTDSRGSSSGRQQANRSSTKISPDHSMSTPQQTTTTQQTAQTTDSNPVVGLTGFQRDILTVLKREGRVYGLRIKRELEAAGYDEIGHGRLYPNLDQLVDEGLIEKGELDRRTNSYELSDTGRSDHDAYLDWAGDAGDD